MLWGIQTEESSLSGRLVNREADTVLEAWGFGGGGGRGTALKVKAVSTLVGRQLELA